MHPLHDYIAEQVVGRINARGVVVWYDARGEFEPFIAELRGEAAPAIGPIEIRVGGVSAGLITAVGSMFEVRTAVEPLVSGERPSPVLIYVAGPPAEQSNSVLMEVEKAGGSFIPQLKQLARIVLKQRYTDGVVDGLLNRDGVTYEDLARASEPDGDGEAPSILKGIFRQSTPDAMLAAWLADAETDATIAAKGGVDELVTLIASRVGLITDGVGGVAKLRAMTARYVLAGEFRDDLDAEPPASVAAIAAPKSNAHVGAVRAIAERLRAGYPDPYTEIADALETELALSGAGIPADRLGSIDTFRFEEQALLGHVENLIAEGAYDDADALITQRERSFWVDQDVARGFQWQASRLMVQLGKVAAEVLAETGTAAGAPDRWIAKYAAPSDGWYLLDQAQRRLETIVAKLDQEPAEKPLGLVRRAYEDAATKLANRFVPALAKSGWSTAATLHQTRVYADIVDKLPKPVAYFLVDAMRYEMGVELAERLPTTAEASIVPAVSALPSITPIGMAALMPGAAASFTIADRGPKFGSQIDETFLPDLISRRKFAEGRVPGLHDLTLGEVIGISAAKLTERVKGAQVIVVRSQEIDAAGEGGFYQARRTMDTVIDDLVRAIKKLATAGVRNAIVSADHGHLFGFGDRDEAQRVDPPGGATVDLHRRCWIGRGGKTPPGCTRVSATTLGYDSDLDLVFPPGIAVFKAGGDLGFHHGGPTLQELIIPVVTVRSAAAASPAKAERATVSNVPYAITTRIFSVELQLGANLGMFESGTVVHPMLMSGEHQVGQAAMAIGAELDPNTGTMRVTPGMPVTIGFMLTDDSVSSLRVVIVDAATDAKLYVSPGDIAVNLGVA